MSEGPKRPLIDRHANCGIAAQFICEAPGKEKFKQIGSGNRQMRMRFTVQYSGYRFTEITAEQASGFGMLRGFAEAWEIARGRESCGPAHNRPMVLGKNT